MDWLIDNYEMDVVDRLLMAIDFPRRDILDATQRGSAAQFWPGIFRELRAGAGDHPTPFRRMRDFCIQRYPRNETLSEIGEAEISLPPGEQTVEPERCRIIVPIAGDFNAEDARTSLDNAGLDPVESWVSPDAASFAVGIRGNNPSDIQEALAGRRGFERATAVAAGEDGMLSSLIISGPDQQRFRATNVPLVATLGDLADAVLPNYDSPGRRGQSRNTIIDRVTPDGQGERQSGSDTVGEAGLRDGEEIRVAYEARAGAMLGEVRRDAVERARNQIVDFARTIEGFIVRADDAFLPSFFDIEFSQPSFYLTEQGQVEPQLDHTVRIVLTAAFPQDAPVVFWLSRIFHPNVLPNYEHDPTRREVRGLVCLGQLAAAYTPSLDLAELCQTLIDIAAYRNYSIAGLPRGEVGELAPDQEAARGDFFDPRAAAWVASDVGQAAINSIGGRQQMGQGETLRSPTFNIRVMREQATPAEGSSSR